MSRNINLTPQETDTPVDKWREKIRSTKNNEHKFKMIVIEKIMSNPNISTKELQDTFFISYPTLNSWVKQYNSNGLEGLKAKNPKGRGSGKGRTKVSDEVYQQLREEMRENPDKKWTLKEKQSSIEKLCGVRVTVQSIRHRMK